MTIRQLSKAALSWDDIWPTVGENDLVYENVPVRFRILPRGTSWEVFSGRSLWGSFPSLAEANARVRAAMMEIFATGGAAQVRFA